MRVLFLTSRATPVGGAEKDLEIHRRALEAHGHEGHVVTCAPAESAIVRWGFERR